MNHSTWVNEIPCLNCGQDLTADARFCPHCNAPVVRKYCPRCSKLIPDHAGSCPYCSAPSDAKPRGYAPYSRVAVALAIVVGLSTVLAMNFSRFSARLSRHNTVTSTVAPGPSITSLPAVPNAAAAANLEGPPAPRGYSISIKPDAKADPARATELNLQAHDLMKQGRYDEAIPVLKQAIAAFGKDTSQPSYAFALYNLGHSLRRTGKPAEAIPLLQKCTTFDAVSDMAQTELDLARAAVERAAAAAATTAADAPRQVARIGEKEKP